MQVLAVVATIAFAGTASFGILSALKLALPLRLRVDAEVHGIDLAKHGREAYHGRDLSDLTGRRTALGDAVVRSSASCGGAVARNAEGNGQLLSVQGGG
ncbi:hypothetical protein [Gemmatimonas sp.]|uniref:hypothetical protein n=1 Tax=Gemmatimonas sp. TaxID=1962908 RepID=UPI0039837FF7